MGNTDLIQVGLFKPIIEILENNGAKTRKLISCSGLNSFSLDNKEQYVPSKLVYNFFSEVKKNEGIDDLLAVFGHDIQLIASGQWGEVMSSMPDLLTTCRLSAKFDQVQLTHERIRFGIEGTKAIYSCKYLDSPTKGRDQVISIILAMLINTIKMVKGTNWTPLEIHLPQHTNINIETLLPRNTTTKLYKTAPELIVVFDTSFLTKPLNGNHIQVSNMPSDYSQRPHSLNLKIKRIFSSSRLELMPTINIVSDYFNISVRNLQRKLVEEGTSYSELIEEWRISQAVQLLEQPSLKIREISHKLKYSHHQAFEKAFKRWTKLSPQRYRENVC